MNLLAVQANPERTKRKLKIVDTVNPNHRVKTGDELLLEALEAYQREANEIVNPAPIGHWLIHRPNRRPERCWEDGFHRNGKPRRRSKTISLEEAGEWPEREIAREEKRGKLVKINAITKLLDS
jgi:hypothetical protein